MAFCVHVWGERACFTRPEMKVERVSYDVPTPSACRGILEAIYWKPAITWVVDRIHVMKPPKFTNLRRNEVRSKISTRNVSSAMRKGGENLFICVEEERQQRASTILLDVEYFIEAHFVARTPDGENHGKHADIFQRHCSGGRCHHQPYFGCREFPAHFELWTEGIRPSPLAGNRDLGYMLFDIDFDNDFQPMFFRATMRSGVVEVPPPESEEVRR